MERKSELIGHLADQAEYSGDWRREKAEQYPDDERNVEAADKLYALAKGLRSLNPQTPLVQRYAQLVDLGCEKILPLPESEILGRVGLNHFFDDAEDFLKSVIREYEKELKEA